MSADAPSATDAALAGNGLGRALPASHRAAVVLAGIAVLGVGLGASPLSSHEVFVVGPAVQMLRNCNWAVPLLGDVPLLDKPPLPAWIAATMIALFGAGLEIAIRAPAVLAAVIAAMQVADLAARWHGPQVGLLAGLVQISCLYVLKYARLVEPDIFLMLCVVGAVCAFHRAAEDPGRSARTRARLAFWGWLGIANLIKGVLFGPVLIVFACGTWAIVARRSDAVRGVVSVPGIAFATVSAALWPALLMIDGQAGAFAATWWSEIIVRGTEGWAPAGPGEPWWYYPPAILWQAAPWVPFLALAGAGSVVTALRDPNSLDARLWCWLLAPTVLLSFAAHKHQHYVVPLLPALSPIMARGIEAVAMRTMSRDAAAAHLQGGVGVAIAVLIALGSCIAALGLPDRAATILPLASASAAGAIAVAIATWHRSASAWMTALTCTVLAVAFVARMPGVAPPNRYAGQRAFLMSIDADLPPGADLVVAGGLDVGRPMFYVSRWTAAVFDPVHAAARVAPSSTPRFMLVPIDTPAPPSDTARIVTLMRAEELPASTPRPPLRYGLYRIEP